MDHSISREKSVESNLETGGTTSEEDATNELDSRRRSSYMLSRVWSGLVSSVKACKPERSGESSDSSVKSDGVVLVSIERGVDREEIQNNVSREKSISQKQKHKTSSKKPPRPPRGPSLDAADQKLVKEIAELAMKKRARIEHMKALKNKKTAKASFSSTSLSAMIFTIFFLLVLFFQGMRCGRSVGLRLMRSPEFAFDGSEGLISIQYYKNFISHEKSAPSHYSPNDAD